jgi:ankyrin repeat protein
MTPLMWAAWKGKAAVVELFISSSAKLDRQEKWGRTALFLAADEGHSEVVGDIVGRYVTLQSFARDTSFRD